MIEQYELRHQQAAPPQALGSAASLSGATIIDTKGYNFARFVVDIGVTNINIASMVINESDNSAMSGAVAVPGTNMGGDANDTGSTSTLPTNGASNTAISFLINCKVSKRYLQLVTTTATQANGQALLSAGCDLARSAETPRSASESGVAQRMIAATP